MKAIITTAWGETPSFTPDAPNPPIPTDGEAVQVKVLASGIHRLVRSQASGAHYSARQLPLPYIPGMDGVGLTPDGKAVYFISMSTGGGFAEYVNVPKAAMVPVSDNADPVQVAGLLNPGMSSWMALKKRVTDVDLSRPWTIAILGVTTQSGKVAVDFARQLGATKVIGIARDEKKMAELALDQTIVLKDNISETEFASMGDVDIVLDYLWGPPFAECVAQLNSKKPTTVVQIGSMAGLESPIPSAALRSKNVTLRGSGPGAWAMNDFAKEAPELVKAVEKLPKQELTERSLEEAAEGWADVKGRTVFVPSKAK